MLKNLPQFLLTIDRVIHKGPPPQTGYENSQFCQNRASNDKSKERFLNAEKNWVVRLLFLHSKLIQKGIWFPIFIVHKAKQKHLSGLLLCLDFITSSSGIFSPKWPPFLNFQNWVLTFWLTLLWIENLQLGMT